MTVSPMGGVATVTILVYMLLGCRCLEDVVAVAFEADRHLHRAFARKNSVLFMADSETGQDCTPGSHSRCTKQC